MDGAARLVLGEVVCRGHTNNASAENDGVGHCKIWGVGVKWSHQRSGYEDR